METETAFIREECRAFWDGETGYPETPDGAEDFIAETVERLAVSLRIAIREDFNRSQLREWSSDDIPQW